MRLHEIGIDIILILALFDILTVDGYLYGYAKSGS
jgi:hypothetical protein